MKRNEMYVRISCGYFDQDTIDEYINQQKECGIDDIVSTVRKQLDEWRNNLNEKEQ